MRANWRKQHNEELRDIVTELKLRGTRRTGHVPRFGKDQKQIQDLLGKSEGDKPLGKHRQRWGDDINMDLKEKR